MTSKNATTRGILFDLDGTLHSREAAFWRWLNAEARLAGVISRVDRDEIATLDQHGKGDKEKLLVYLDNALDWGDSAAKRLRRFRSGIVEHVQLEPGMFALLESLREHYLLGVVTNGAGVTQRGKLERLGILPFFEPVIVSGEAGCRKPNVEIFELAIKDWPLARQEVLFIGDDPLADVEGARAAGLRALQVTSPSEVLSALAPLARPSAPLKATR